jgi:hypothetical protein
MGQKIDTRAVGLDAGLALIRWLTGAESLHYGLWTGLEVTAGNLRRAQDAYTEKLFALMPAGPAHPGYRRRRGRDRQEAARRWATGSRSSCPRPIWRPAAG